MDDKGIDRITDKLFDTIDTNANQLIEKRELRNFAESMLAYLKPNAKFCEKSFERGYKQLDANGNGSISKSELTVIVKQIHKKQGSYKGSIVPTEAF